MKRDRSNAPEIPKDRPAAKGSTNVDAEEGRDFVVLKATHEPQSIRMMRHIILELLVRSYGVDGDNIASLPVLFADGTYGYGLEPMSAEQGDDVFEDPDFYVSITAMLSDLAGHADLKKIEIPQDQHFILFTCKLAMFEALKALACELGLNCVDTVLIERREDEHTDPALAHQRMVESMTGVGERMKDLAFETTIGNELFTRAQTIPHISLSHYYARLSCAYEAEISVSFDHLYKTILQEEKKPGINPRDDLLRHGGYN